MKGNMKILPTIFKKFFIKMTKGFKITIKHLTTLITLQIRTNNVGVTIKEVKL